MRRIDWRLIPPLKEGVDSDGGLGRRINALVERAAAGELDEEGAAELAASERRLSRLRMTSCAAVDAPKVKDDPNWEARVLDEYAESASEMEMEAYLEARSLEPDCERCPYASPYSLFPMDPCEFTASGFAEVLLDGALVRRLEQPMDAAAMAEAAEILEEALLSGEYRKSRVFDVSDYLDKAILFLRFWSSHGFAIQPETFAGVEPPDEEHDTEEDEDDGQDEGPMTLH